MHATKMICLACVRQWEVAFIILQKHDLNQFDDLEFYCTTKTHKKGSQLALFQPEKVNNSETFSGEMLKFLCDPFFEERSSFFAPG